MTKKNLLSMFFATVSSLGFSQLSYGSNNEVDLDGAKNLKRPHENTSMPNAKRQRNEDNPLLKLPDEVLAKIAGQIDKKDLCALRSTSKKTLQIADEIVFGKTPGFHLNINTELTPICGIPYKVRKNTTSIFSSVNGDDDSYWRLGYAQHLLSKFPNLKSFTSFRANGWTTDGSWDNDICNAIAKELINAFSNSQRLERLDLHDVIHASIADLFLPLLKNTNSIRTLSLAQNVMGSIEYRNICNAIATNTRIKNLNLSQIGYIDESFFPPLAAAIEINTALIHLKISGCLIGDNIADLLSLSISRNPQTALEVLDISNNNIQAAGADSLATTIKTAVKLRKVLLHSNPITEAGLNSLIDAILENPNFHYLSVSGNGISEKAKVIAKRLLEDRIEFLDLTFDPSYEDNAGWYESNEVWYPEG